MLFCSIFTQPQLPTRVADTNIAVAAGFGIASPHTLVLVDDIVHLERLGTRLPDSVGESKCVPSCPYLVASEYRLVLGCIFVKQCYIQRLARRMANTP